MAQGTLIAESLRLHAALDGVRLGVTKVTRLGPLEGLAPGQPEVWTFIEFTIADEVAPHLADALARALDVGGWYCDFRTEDETFVVFADRVFRYPRGSAGGRDEAAAHARAEGVPEGQIDWPE